MDYDHNTPDAGHLQRTHRPFFEIIRKAHPQLPVVFVSSPTYHRDPEYYELRRQVILDTFLSAQGNGDNRLWFVDGKTFFPADRWGDCTVDCLHPNDAGFRRMTDLILPTVKTALASRFPA